jgi:hypothetical protein
MRYMPLDDPPKPSAFRRAASQSSPRGGPAGQSGKRRVGITHTRLRQLNRHNQRGAVAVFDHTAGQMRLILGHSQPFVPGTLLKTPPHHQGHKLHKTSDP